MIHSRKKELSADCKLTLVKSERHLNGKYKSELRWCSLHPISRGTSLDLFPLSIIEFMVSLLVLLRSSRGGNVDCSFRRNQLTSNLSFLKLKTLLREELYFDFLKIFLTDHYVRI